MLSSSVSESAAPGSAKAERKAPPPPPKLLAWRPLTLADSLPASVTDLARLTLDIAMGPPSRNIKAGVRKIIRETGI